MSGRGRNRLCPRCGKKAKKCSCKKGSGRFVVPALVVTALLVAGGMLLLRDGSDEKSDSAGKAKAEKPTNVPSREHLFKLTVGQVDHLPRVGTDTLNQAFQLMLELEDAPALQTDDDKAVFKLVHAYVNQEWEIRLQIGKPVWNEADGSERSGRMSYSCEDDMFTGNPFLEPTVPFFAATIYHELMHRVVCLRQMRELGITDHAKMSAHLEPERCVTEQPGWEAQIRFSLALRQKGRLPTHLSSGDGSSDAGHWQMTYEAWNALLEDRFCDWYEWRLRVGGKITSTSGFNTSR